MAKVEINKRLGNPELWLEEHGDYLFRFALSRVRSRETAEDLVQETLLAAVRAQNSFQGRSTARTWLVSILKNKIIDHFRKANREILDNEGVVEPSEGPECFNTAGIWNSTVTDWAADPTTLLERKEFHKVLSECLQKLPHKMREIFTLKVLDDVDSKEICKVLGVSSSNLWVLLHRARMGLRDCIEKNWIETK